MAEDPRPPVAIRVTRPYPNEDEFLRKELETVTKTSIVLLGAQPRPQGVVLRFEVALTSGAALVRGEGRVVSYRERAFGDLPGLTLRFTRLDSRSKALVDRAAAMREERARLAFSVPPASEPPPSLVPSAAPPVAEGPRRSKRPSPREPVRGTPREGERTGTEAPSAVRARPDLKGKALPEMESAAREALLGRLRERARSLDAPTVARILSKAQ